MNLNGKSYLAFLMSFIAQTPEDFSPKLRVNKLKQLLGFIFKSNPQLLEKRPLVLGAQHQDPRAFLAFVLPLLQEGWNSENRCVNEKMSFIGFESEPFIRRMWYEGLQNSNFRPKSTLLPPD